MKGKGNYLFFALALIGLVAIFSFGVGNASAANVYVNAKSGNDSWNGLSPIHTTGNIGPNKDIKTGINHVKTNGTLKIANGLYTGTKNYGITINKNITITGQSSTNTIINAQKRNWIFIIPTGSIVKISNLKLTQVNGAISNDGTLTLTNTNFNKNSNSAISNRGLLTVKSSTFTSNTATSGGAINNIGGWLTIKSSTFTSNTATSGGAINNYWSIIKWNPSDVSLNVTDSTFTDNHAISVGGAIYNEGSAILHFNRIVGNTAYVGASPSGSAIFNDIGIGGIVNATLNWWGTNNGTKIANMLSSTVPITNIIYNPWIVLTIKANPASVYVGGTSTVTANLLYSSNGVYHNPVNGVVPYSGSANFKTTKGAIKNNTFIKGKATSTLTKLNTTGTATVYATVDGQTVTTRVTIRTKPISPLKK